MKVYSVMTKILFFLYFFFIGVCFSNISKLEDEDTDEKIVGGTKNLKYFETKFEKFEYSRKRNSFG